jgi:hypothetical protein
LTSCTFWIYKDVRYRSKKKTHQREGIESRGAEEQTFRGPRIVLRSLQSGGFDFNERDRHVVAFLRFLNTDEEVRYNKKKEIQQLGGICIKKGAAELTFQGRRYLFRFL